MSNENIVLPLDLRKSILTNKVEAEEHYVSVNRKILVAKHGFFYTDTFKVKLKDSSDYLILDEDFKFGTIDQDLTLKTGSKVTSYITFLRYELTPNVFEIECHYVGGERSASTTKLTHLIEDLKNRQKPVDFKQIKGKPTAYRPKPDHLHHVNDLYGLEYIIKPLELLKNGLNIGDEFIHKEIRDLIDNVQDFIDTHSNSTNNPHDDDKSSIGLSLLMNYSFANQDDLINRVPDKYIGPQGVKYLIDEEAKGPLESHFYDFNNPHELTKEQIELGLVQNFGVANLPVSIAGVSNERYITPNGFSHLLNDLVTPSLNNHIFDINDPHELTKAQVHLGNVQNFGIASKEEAEEGVRNDRYMTPLRTNEAILRYLALNPIHINMRLTGGRPANQSYTSPTEFTWTKPVGIFSYMEVEMWGGGGGGAAGNHGLAGGGGGGGGYVRFRVSFMDVPDSSYLRVGAGGPQYSSNFSTYGHGYAGTDSNFLGAIAGGGGGGRHTFGDQRAGGGARGGVQVPSVPHFDVIAEMGGHGGDGDSRNGGSVTGHPGGSTTYSGAGGGGSAEFNNNPGGAGGTSTFGGNGGRGSRGASDDATGGSVPGGGGGGSVYNGRAGGHGRILIRYV